MFIMQCNIAGLFLMWSMVGVMCEKAGLPKQNKFASIMIPAVLVMFILGNFVFPFAAGSIVQISFFKKGMADINPAIDVPFLGWIGWWIAFMIVYIVVYLLFFKYVMRIKFPEIVALGDELAKMGDDKQKMTGDQKFGLFILVFL